MAWSVARILSQLVWVVLLVRALGMEGYGSFSGLAGLALALSGLAGAGLGWRLYQDVARDRSLFARRWAQATRALLWSGITLTAVFVMVGGWLFPEFPLLVVVAVAVAELALMPFVHQVTCAFSAHGRVVPAAVAPVAVSVSRVVAAGVLYILPGGKTLEAYACLHLLSVGAVVLMLRQVTIKTLSPGAASPSTDGRALLQGLGFASVWASGTALTSLDKVLVLRLGDSVAAGEYTAAFRIASLAALPVEAMATAVLPRLFHEGTREEPAWGLVYRMFLVSLVYGILAGSAVWLLAPHIAWVLGAEVAAVVGTIHVLAICVPAYCLYLLGVQILLGFGWKQWRFAVDLSGLGLLVFLMARWVPESGSLGAGKALLACELLLATLVWLRVGIGIARPRNANREP